ncbi:MAG: hypothetical protein HC827_04295 [Cyanobacteria bacterium RM1_2_2]|nr:hypothetical protein [Cyanobacteria bacterium RM1_2_2]
MAKRKWKWRLVWLGGLVLLWLFCSGVAVAAPLADRVSQYPNWQGKPPVQAARGDLVYPDWFAGEWLVTTTLVDLVAPLAPDIVTPGFESNQAFLNQPIQFRVRFVEQPRRSMVSVIRAPQQLVSDRAYNGMQLAKAYLGERAVLAVKVDPKNPNRQITLMRGDRQLVSTVAARATESMAADQFITSEVFKQEFRGAPQIYFNEVENTTAYTKQPRATSPDSPMISADQITAVYLSPQEPDYFKTLSSESILPSPRPVALYRYQMTLRRPQ